MAQKRALVLLRERAEMTKAIAPALRSRGWQVSVQELSEESVESLEPQAFDLIILEIVSAGSAGLALCETIRKRSKTPLLLILSTATSGDAIQGFYRGADAYVVEPFDMRELIVRAEALVRRAAGHLRQSASG
ncbi:MAG: hypothetical protein Kow0047_02090 [Anaerolineae bacterium]